MDEMHDEQGWLRGGGLGGGVSEWQSHAATKDGHHREQQHSSQQLRDADPFAEFADWPAVGAEAAPFSSSSSWQLSMHEHDSTFPSAYPLFADAAVQSLTSPSNFHSSTSTFSLTASVPHAPSDLHFPHSRGQDSLLSSTAAKSASEAQWPSRTTTPFLADLTSPSLSLASTVLSSCASSALSSTPSSVNSSSPVSPLIISHREAARRPDFIRVPPFESGSSPLRPTFTSPVSLSSSLPSPSQTFASAPDAPAASGAEPSKYQSRDMTSGTPIFSSSSVSPPNLPPRMLLSRNAQAQSQSASFPLPPPPAVAASPFVPSDRSLSPPVAFRSTDVAAATPPFADSLSHLQSLHFQSNGGKERKQTSVRATRKSVENSPLTGMRQQPPSSQSLNATMASAPIVAAHALPSSIPNPPAPKRKSARKLGVMIDVPIKPGSATAAAFSGHTPPKSKRTMSRAGAFSPQSFVSSPPSPSRPIASPVVATISPLTEQRTMRANGVTVASPVEANPRLAPYLANTSPASPTAAAPVGPFSHFLASQPQHTAVKLAARAVPVYDDEHQRGSAQFAQHSQSRQQHSFHAKLREEFKSNDEAQLSHAPARFVPPDEHSLPSTPHSPASSTHETLSLLTGGYPSAAPLWSRQYSAPAAMANPPFAQSSSDSPTRQSGGSERGTFAVPQQQPTMSRSMSGAHSDRSYQPADISGAIVAWAEQQYANRARQSQPTTPMDNVPYADGLAIHSSLSLQRPTYLDETAANASFALAAKLSAMQRATSAPSQPQLPQAHHSAGRQRTDSDSRGGSMERQVMPTDAQSHPASSYNSPALAGLRHQQLLEHFKQSNPTLQALSPEATSILARLMSAEQAQPHARHDSPSMQPSSATHYAPSKHASRPPSSSSTASQQAHPASVHQPCHMPAFSEAQLQQLQQHLGLQQLQLQHKLVQQTQHHASRPSSQQHYDARHAAPQLSNGVLTSCPMSSAGCDMQFLTASEMQAHFLACHV